MLSWLIWVVVATAVVYWASAIRVSWGRGGVERACVLVCVSVCNPPAPHILLFFSLGKASMSPVITGGAFEVSRVLCVYARLFSHLKATPPVCRPLPCSVWVCVSRLGGTSSCHCSLGHCPCPVCLSVYLSLSLPASLVRLLVSPCCRGVAGLAVSVLLARLQNDTGWEIIAETLSHIL